MARQHIDIGTVPNDGTGDTLRDGGDKINDNFIELYDGKADKIIPASVGNIAGLDAGGNLSDSGIDPNSVIDVIDATDTNGFPSAQRDATTISFVNGTRTFTIAPTGSDFYYYELGVKYEKTSSEDIVIPDSEGLHVVYYDADTLTTDYNPTQGEISDVIRTKAIVAYVYWDATNNEYLYLGDERHGISMSPETHAYLHFSRGAQFLSGLALSGILADEDGSSDTHAQFGVGSGYIVDEDLLITIGAIGSTTGLPVYYLSGAGVDLRKDTNAGFSVLTTGTGRLAWNEYTGGAWQLTEVANNDFVLCHVFATNDIDSPMIAFIGQGDYPTIGQARTGANNEIASLITVLPLEEKVPVATLIFQTSNGYSNAVQGRVRTTDTGADYINWLTSELAQGASPTSHNNLLDLELAQSGVTNGHVDDQAQTIAGVKTFASIPVLPASDPTTDNQAARKVYVDGLVEDVTYSLGIACSDEETDLTANTDVATFRMPYAMTLTEVRASVTTAPTGSTLVVDINESGTTILSTKLSIDASEYTSETAATAPVISDSSIADDAEITIDIDQVGSTIAGTGLKVTLIGTLT